MLLSKLLFSCEETGVGGKNEVLEDGNNFWINDVEGGSNQTYLTLNVRIKLIYFFWTKVSELIHKNNISLLRKKGKE